jgi:hypothetical protein
VADPRGNDGRQSSLPRCTYQQSAFNSLKSQE